MGARGTQVAGCLVAAVVLPTWADKMGAPSWVLWAIVVVALASAIFTLLAFDDPY